MTNVVVAGAGTIGSLLAAYLAGIAENLHIYISNGIRNPS